MDYKTIYNKEFNESVKILNRLSYINSKYTKMLDDNEVFNSQDRIIKIDSLTRLKILMAQTKDEELKHKLAILIFRLTRDLNKNISKETYELMLTQINNAISDVGNSMTSNLDAITILGVGDDNVSET